MMKRWLPDPGTTLQTQGLNSDALAEQQAQLLSRCWDDNASYEANLATIGYWLAESEREPTSF
ncbi:MAG: hypothetical protein RIA65_07350 [Woeseia sp.]